MNDGAVAASVIVTAPRHQAGRDPAGAPDAGVGGARCLDRGPAAPPRRAERDEMTTHEEHVWAAADTTTGQETTPAADLGDAAPAAAGGVICQAEVG